MRKFFKIIWDRLVGVEPPKLVTKAQHEEDLKRLNEKGGFLVSHHDRG